MRQHTVGLAKLLVGGLLFGLPACGSSDQGSEPSAFLGKADSPDRAGVYRAKVSFDSGGQRGYLVLEVLDDDLVHFAFGAGDGPSVEQPIYASAMVQKRDYQGPLKAGFTVNGRQI